VKTVITNPLRLYGNIVAALRRLRLNQPLARFKKEVYLVKKFFVLLCVLVLFAGFVAADDIGLTAGLEFGVGNVTKANDGEWEPYLTPSITYEKSFLDDALDLYAELDYTFDFKPNFEELSQYLYFDLSLGYNLNFGSASTLSFILENEIDEFNISPRSDGNNFTGIFTPAVKFNQELGIGDIYAKASVPITYIQDEKDADKEVDLKFRLGWDSAFGLGLWAQLNSKLVPDFVGYNGFDANVSYETDVVYFEVTANIPKELSDNGINITPEFDYYFGNFTFYIKCKFAGVAANTGSVAISPALGIKFSF